MRRTGVFFLGVCTAGCFSPSAGSDPVPAGDDTSGADTSSTTQPSPTSSTTAPSPTTTAESDTTTTGDDTTSSAPQTTESSSTGEPADPFCGDGNVDRGEQCDDGDANANTAACREDCTMASCGDDNVWEGVEACDDGMAGNQLEVGACAPDCSRVIEERIIIGGEFLPDDGNLGGNPVGVADGSCPVGYGAMFVVPGVRHASVTPLAGDGQLDWVLHPYTAYVNDDDVLMWITDDVALLGVRNGVAMPLLAPPTDFDFDQRVVSGLSANWTNALTNNCNGWSSSGGITNYGDPLSTTQYMYTGTISCDGWYAPGDQIVYNLTYVYCVEQ